MAAATIAPIAGENFPVKSPHMVEAVYPLFTAILAGRTEEVRQLLAAQVDIDERGGRHRSSALHIAAANGKEELVLLLLERGADVSVQNSNGWTPLHGAAHQGREDNLRLLLEHAADPSVKGNDGRTALHAACVMGRVGIVQLLLDGGADMQMRSNSGETPEDIATEQDHPQIAAMLQAEAVRREEMRRAQCVAFAAGHHERLGAGSRVQELDAGVVRMVLEYV